MEPTPQPVRSPVDARPTWPQTWLAVATALSYRSRCDRRQVGAVIVTTDDRVASVGYNGPPAGRRVTGTCSGWCSRAQLGDERADYSSCEAAHAEANALLRSSWAERKSGSIYVSSAMCVNCARLVANSGLTRVYHVVRPDDAHRDPDGVEELLKSCGLAVSRVTLND